MSTVRNHCALCGTVTVPAQRVRLVVASGQLSRSWYEMPCPRCGDQLTGQAGSPMLRRMLAQAGAVIDVAPAEALEDHSGPAIGWDDVLDLVLELEADGGKSVAPVPEARMP